MMMQNLYTSPWIPLFILYRATCHYSCSLKKLSFSKPGWLVAKCHVNGMPFHFLYYIGNCYVNAPDMSKREMIKLKFGACHLRLHLASFHLWPAKDVFSNTCRIFFSVYVCIYIIVLFKTCYIYRERASVDINSADTEINTAW